MIKIDETVNYEKKNNLLKYPLLTDIAEGEIFQHYQSFYQRSHETKSFLTDVGIAVWQDWQTKCAEINIIEPR